MDRRTKSEHEAERRATADKRAARAERDEADREAIIEHWPADVAYTWLHPHRLYSTVGTVKIGDQYKTYPEPDRVTRADVAALLDKLPPLPLASYRDGCRKIAARDYIQDEHGDRPDNIQDMYGVTVDVEDANTVTWTTELAPGVRVEVEAVLADAESIAYRLVDARRDRRTGKVLEVTSTTLRAKDGGPWHDQRIKWSSGGSEYPSKFTLWWLDQDETEPASRVWADTICGGID